MNPSKASNTAKVIAASTVLLASDPRTAMQVAQGAAALCETLLSGTRVDRWLAASAKHPFTRAMWRWVERSTLPGIMSHYWNRKRWIECRCRTAIAEGFERVIVLGAGFDTLGLRLATEMQQIEVIEIDHPATQNAKKKALAQSKVTCGSNLRFIPHDLSEGPLPTALPLDQKSTFVIVEGVLMYLSPSEVAQLFAALGKLAQGRLQILFSFMTRWPDGGCGFRPRSALIERWLKSRKEPFTWSLEPAALASFLAMHQLKLLEMVLTRQLFDKSQIPTSNLDGENLAVCEPT